MTLATLVGLLCNWKQERGSVAQDRFQDFITWLEQHHFNDLKLRITSSEELQRELNSLLRDDVASLAAKLESISSGIAEIGSKLDHFEALVGLLGAASHELSDQAIAVLHTFYSTEGATCFQLGYLGPDDDVHIFIPGIQDLQVKEPRFLIAEIEALCRLGFLKSREAGADQVEYHLTRSGAAYAKQVKPKAGWVREAPAVEMASGGWGGY